MDNICVPIHLDAFALAPGCCDGPSSLAPYTQPNYTSLRLDSHLIQHDVLDHVDFHLSSPSWKNPRLADIGRPVGEPPGKNLKLHRMGVHLSWSLPRLYRSAQASGKSAKQGEKPENAPNPNPKFRPFPNRWLVVRHLKNWKDENKLKEWQSWVVESDVVRKITSPQMQNVKDLESDVSPFISFQSDQNDQKTLRNQTEVFLGQKFDLAAWKEVPESTRQHMPKLTIMNSSNPLFPDNALHNVNVLSMIDNFAYADPGRADGVNYLRKANCDYFVIGWHSKPDDDPFNDPKKIDLASRLSGLLVKLNDKLAKDEDLTKNENPTRCLVHGAVYGVSYDFEYKPKEVHKDPQKPPPPPDPKRSSIRSLANEAALKFTDDIKMEPLSIGTTPLDGILTFLEAHKADADEVFGVTGASSLAESLMDIAQLLYATGDNYDSRVQAQDLIAQQNFSKIDGGSRWVFSKTTSPGQPTETPKGDVKQRLIELNKTQTRLDATQRTIGVRRWELFAEWWKFVSKFVFLRDKDIIEGGFRTEVNGLKDSIDHLSSLITSLTSELDSKKDPATCKLTTSDPYHGRMDPTLCIAGLDPGWPGDWQDTLTIRLDNEIDPDAANVVDTIFSSMGAANPITPDHGLIKTARKVFAQFLKNKDTENGADGKPKIIGFQQWASRNPFVPIYIEWEGIYYHVGPFDEKWDVRLRPSPVGHAHHTLRYVPKEVLAQKDENHKDFRSVSGRVLVLPQPVFSLEAIVKQVLDSASKDVDLTEAQKTDLRNNIRNLQFVSAPLSGLTNHLLTRFEGAHVKPNVRVQQGDRGVRALKAAVRTAIGIDEDMLVRIDSESALTPYGDSFPFGTDQYPGVPFKPVTHGQMILTKLNIIDKFGQAVCMPKILRRPRVAPAVPQSTIDPCLSDWLAPDALENADPKIKDKTMNTVYPTNDPVRPGQWPLCQYVQLTPSINQDTRINASFLMRTTDPVTKKYSRWQEATDYDPMIWGWVIVNYADNGLQFFLGDGTFYREIRKGGVEGTNVSAKWLPYDLPDHPDTPRDAGEAQLAALIETLRDVKYFQRFSNAINGAIKNMPFPPSDYSGYANAIVGKPLALVNVGWSLELATPAIESQNSLGNPAKDPYATLHNYSFPLKIGDIERNYDGVCGYWKSDNDAACKTHFETMNTYFVTTWSNLPAGTVLQLPGTATPRKTYTVLSGDTIASISAKLTIPTADIKSSNPGIPDSTPTDTFRPIAPGNFLNLNPYYTDPLTTPDMLFDRCDKYNVTTLLIDPYTPLHGYSPILPTKSLTLPSWAIQTPFEKMHAFFHLGPILLTTDVPLTKDSAANKIISLPVSGRKGTWNWFQPYATANPADVNPSYAQMQVQEDLGDKKFEKPPYTFIEGFLQLMGSLEAKAKAQAAAR